MDVEDLIDIYETKNDTRTQRKQSRLFPLLTGHVIWEKGRDVQEKKFWLT